MKGKILLAGFLLIFCLSSGCGLLNKKVIYSSSQTQVQVSPSQNQPSVAVLKGDCSLQIKNYADQEITVCLKNVAVGKVSAGSEMIFFNSLDCRCSELMLETAGYILLVTDLTMKESNLYWTEQPVKGNFWTVWICPDLTVRIGGQEKCQ